jgi:hypothetical protein
VWLGFVRIWLIVLPEDALPPVILPVTGPNVQAKLLGELAVKTMPGAVPLHVTAVAALVTAGVGFTVTVIVKAGPTHDPVVDVGVTRYSTVPAVELLGLVRIWLIVPPEAALAPVILPVIVPIVQAKLLGKLEVKMILGPVPLHVLTVDELVTDGLG